MKLSNSFFLEEFEHSNAGARAGIDNTLPQALMPNLLKLVYTLQEVRNFFGQPLIVSSGYRCKALNALVGGAPNSDHILAAAADFIVPGYGSPYEICMALSYHLDQFRIKQIILEHASWVHIGVIPVADINRILTIDRNGVRTGILKPRLVHGRHQTNS